MPGTYDSSELQAMRDTAWGDVLQANKDLEHMPYFITWRLRVEARFTSMVLYYLDGDGRDVQHRIIL